MQEIAPNLTKPDICKHCATPLRTNQVDFCCMGCEFVFKTINGLGLTSFYQLRDSNQAIQAEASIPNKSYDYLEDTELQKKFLIKLAEDKYKADFYLPTIHCSACIWLLEKLPTVVEGVKSSRVSFRSGQIEIIFNPQIIALKQLASVLNSLGYPPIPADDLLLQKQNQKDDRQALTRIGIAGLATMNTMMFGDALFESVNTGMDDHYRQLFTWTSAILTLPVVTYCAMPFYRKALASLIMGSIHLDLPISIAIIITYLADIFTLINGGPKVYFDSINCLVFLLLLARYIQHKAVSRARLSVNTTWDLFPATVNVQEGDQVINKKISELQIGDLVRVAPNERIPSDGAILEGVSSIDMSLLNGESNPKEVHPGMEVFGGTLNIENFITVKISGVGKLTRLGKIIENLKQASNNKTILETEVDQLSRYFVIIVLILAIANFIIWYFLNPEVALSHTIGLLVITCPCALGLAIPATLSVAIAKAQKVGIYVKDPQALQALANAKSFYFDKTGTLTVGKLSVIKFFGDQKYLESAKTLAQTVASHPVSKAILNFCEKSPSLHLDYIKHHPAKGVEGIMPCSGEKIILGSIRWMEEQQILIPEKINLQFQEHVLNGSPITLLSEGNKVVGCFVLQDQIAPHARDFIKRLKASGKNIFILSGDSQSVVDAIAKDLKLPPSAALGALYPEQKAEIIKNDPEIKIMIGDGVNDALAMQVATLGIGLSGGIESTLENAGIYVGKEGLNGVISSYQGAQRMKAVIRRNLIFSLTYNIVGASAAMFGYITPLVASVMMPFSSLIVVLSSILDKYFNKIINTEDH